jgi:hypothetical protein
MGRSTKDTEAPDTLLPAWEAPDVQAAGTRIRDLEATRAILRAHAAQFPRGKMSLAAVTATQDAEDAEAALAAARPAYERALEAARSALRELRLPEENRLRLLQYRKAAELKAVTEDLFKHVTESRNLGATPPNAMSIGEVIPFAILLDEEPHRASALTHIERDLKERNIRLD